MFRWMETQKLEKCTNLVEYTQEESKQAGYAQDNINYIRKQAERERVKVRAGHQLLDKEINYTNKKLSAAVSNLIVRKDQNFHQIRARYILQQWYRFTANRKKCCKVLENAISKILLQRTFDELREKHLADIKEEKENKKSAKICRISRKLNERFALHKWRRIILAETNKTIGVVQVETETAVKWHNDFVQRTKSH